MRDAYGHGIDRMLMLGGGGFAYPKFALMSHEGLRMDVIEYDGEITRLARRWFYLDELERAAGDRLRVITAEARSYLGVTSVGPSSLRRGRERLLWRCRARTRAGDG